MTKMICALTLGLLAIGTTARAAEGIEPAAAVSAPAVTEEKKAAEDDTLFTRVNDTYRKTQKQLQPRS